MPSKNERWILADRLFDAALNLPAEERVAFLDDACGEDAELRALMNRLLDETQADDDSLLTPGGAMAGPLVDRLVDDLDGTDGPAAGTLLGHYRILRELGRGGMAVVYLAERADGLFEQHVALKLIKRGIDTDEVLQRFDQERQILALVQHPCIAQLLDGGVSADGRPYFAMELVEGLPIDRYCDENRLSIPQRLELFLQVARAVGYAHRNLVVHRDIKPSNILVSHDGHPKLLDFGIAKLVDPEEIPGSSALTRTQARLMTPAFASPEQIRGGPVTTASDIYQLGLLLYQLMTGRWPYGASQEQNASEVIRAICEDPPTRPSSVVAHLTMAGEPISPETSELISQARGSSSKRLRRELAGDLDKIILMALRKEPERRYASVAQLVDDIERFMTGRPVAAQADTFVYRASKFVRRNAAATVTAVTALVLIATLAVVYTWQLAEERDRARLAADRATQVSDFLRGLFAVSAPTRSKGEKITARQLLDRGARRIEEELVGQPELRADMMTLMGDVYRELALYEEARPLLEGALELRRDDGEEEDPLALASSLHAMARLVEEEGGPDAAQTLYEHALGLREAVLGSDHPEVARTLDGLARVLKQQGQFEPARQHLERALKILEATLGPDDADVGLVLKDLGALLEDLREREAARTVLERALKILEQHFEADHPFIASTRIHLGDVLRFTGDPKGARQQYEKALASVEQAYGPDHPEVAEVLNKLGNLLNSEDDPQAVAIHRRALAIREAALGTEHPKVAASLNNLGLTYLTLGEIETARPSFERCVAILEEALGPDHVDLAPPLKHLAEIHDAEGDLSGAIELYQQVLTIRERAYGPNHSFLNQSLYRLGQLEMERGNAAVAEPLLRRAVEVVADDESTSYRLLRSRFELGRCLTSLGQLDEAESLLRPLTQGHGVDVLQCQAQDALVELYRAWGKTELADRAQAARRLLDPLCK